jgi:hypothetical protein
MPAQFLPLNPYILPHIPLYASYNPWIPPQWPNSLITPGPPNTPAYRSLLLKARREEKTLSHRRRGRDINKGTRAPKVSRVRELNNNRDNLLKLRKASSRDGFLNIDSVTARTVGTVKAS